jgi:sulfate transport system permease protein
MTTFAARRRHVLPGFGLSLGYTILYLSLIVLIPLSMLFFKTSQLGWAAFAHTITDAEVVATYKLSFGASLIAAAINVVVGVPVAWVLGRYRFPGRRLLDAIVDLPFALPTAVAGISLCTLYSPDGWIGRYLNGASFPGHIASGLSHRLQANPIQVDFTRAGVVIALIFIGLPFVVRTIQPVLEDMDLDSEEAAANLGASRIQTLRRVVLPPLYPAIVTGFALAFARALGEYGSVVFISGNLPYQTEIIPQMIVSKLEEYNYPGATAIAVVMLLASFAILLAINLLQWALRRRQGAA